MMLPLPFARAPQEKPPVRDMRPGLERKYRVTVTRGDDRTTYRLRARVVETKAAKGERGEIRIDLRLTDYRASVDGHVVASRFLGGGPMAPAATGLPEGLSIAGPQGPVWLPLLSLYLPANRGDFLVPKVEVGGGIVMAGKGRLGKRVEIEAILSRMDVEIGKLTLATMLDPQGWPTKAEGTLVSADGTYGFTLER